MLPTIESLERALKKRFLLRGWDSGAGAATRSAGDPAYPMSYIGAGEGLRPLRTPDPWAR